MLRNYRAARRFLGGGGGGLQLAAEKEYIRGGGGGGGRARELARPRPRARHHRVCVYFWRRVLFDANHDDRRPSEGVVKTTEKN